MQLARDLQARDARVREVDRRMADAMANHHTLEDQIASLQQQLAQTQQHQSVYNTQKPLGSSSALSTALTTTLPALPTRAMPNFEAVESSAAQAKRGLFPAYVQLKRDNEQLHALVQKLQRQLEGKSRALALAQSASAASLAGVPAGSSGASFSPNQTRELERAKSRSRPGTQSNANANANNAASGGSGSARKAMNVPVSEPLPFKAGS